MAATTERSVQHCTPQAEGAPLHFTGFSYWASEASPTLWCSIEILRDIYICMYVCLRLSMGKQYKKSYAKMRGRNYVESKHTHAHKLVFRV